MNYTEAPDVKKMIKDIIEKLDFFHIPPKSIYCYRSKGSKSKRIIARIHGFSKIWQKALKLPPTYIIEVLSEKYEKLSQHEKEKTLIHELMHIPKGFKGGFRSHRMYVNKEKVEKMYKIYQDRKNYY